MTTSLDLVTFSTLYPNSAQPGHGLFVEARLKHLRAHHAVSASVIAPVPWFPLRHPMFGQYAQFARAPRVEQRNDIDVWHPRYPVVPKIGMHMAPHSLALGARASLARVLRDRSTTPVLDAHYFYPDGVAAAHLANRFGLPLVITARGSDVNRLPDFPAVRRRILWAAQRAQRVIAVSQALAARMRQLGMPAEKIRVLRNGVDLEMFHVQDRHAAREALGLDGPTVLSVGNLLELKGHHLVIEALARHPRATLIIAGSGPLSGQLKAQVQSLGLTSRVRFVGSVQQSELVRYYNAADMLVLASSREGMANVLLETLACGTPAVATGVGGNAEVISGPQAGLIVARRHVDDLADAMGQIWHAPPQRAATRRYAETFAWRDVADGLHTQLCEARDEYAGT